MASQFYVGVDNVLNYCVIGCVRSDGSARRRHRIFKYQTHGLESGLGSAIVKNEQKLGHRLGERSPFAFYVDMR